MAPNRENLLLGPSFEARPRRRVYRQDVLWHFAMGRLAVPSALLAPPIHSRHDPLEAQVVEPAGAVPTRRFRTDVVGKMEDRLERVFAPPSFCPNPNTADLTRTGHRISIPTLAISSQPLSSRQPASSRRPARDEARCLGGDDGEAARRLRRVGLSPRWLNEGKHARVSPRPRATVGIADGAEEPFRAARGQRVRLTSDEEQLPEIASAVNAAAPASAAAAAAAATAAPATAPAVDEQTFPVAPPTSLLKEKSSGHSTGAAARLEALLEEKVVKTTKKRRVKAAAPAPAPSGPATPSYLYMSPRRARARAEIDSGTDGLDAWGRIRDSIAEDGLAVGGAGSASKAPPDEVDAVLEKQRQSQLSLNEILGPEYRELTVREQLSHISHLLLNERHIGLPVPEPLQITPNVMNSFESIATKLLKQCRKHPGSPRSPRSPRGSKWGAGTPWKTSKGSGEGGGGGSDGNAGGGGDGDDGDGEGAGSSGRTRRRTIDDSDSDDDDDGGRVEGETMWARIHRTMQAQGLVKRTKTPAETIASVLKAAMRLADEAEAAAESLIAPYEHEHTSTL